MTKNIRSRIQIKGMEKTDRPKSIIPTRNLRNNLRIPLPLRLTSSDEIPNDGLVDLRPVPARADSDVRDDVHVGFLVQPRVVAYRAVLDVDHALESIFGA